MTGIQKSSHQSVEFHFNGILFSITKAIVYAVYIYRTFQQNIQFSLGYSLLQLIGQVFLTSSLNIAMRIRSILLLVAATFTLETCLVMSKPHIKTKKLATFFAGLAPAWTPQVTERAALLSSEVQYVRICS